jgi:hypothetical protein
VGVPPKITLRRGKLFVRSFSSVIVSPCSRTFVLQSSGSSTATTGAGVDFTELGLLEPTNFRKPPGKPLNCQRLSLSRRP